MQATKIVASEQNAWFERNLCEIETDDTTDDFVAGELGFIAANATPESVRAAVARGMDKWFAAVKARLARQIIDRWGSRP
ncbi:MAG: hypothetical protein WAN65_17855 [Candidatus Sulfotelmatobacter sp.]